MKYARDAWTECAHRYRHAVHLLDALEAVHALHRKPSRGRGGDDDPRLVDPVTEDRDQCLALAAREARAERQRFDDERTGDDLVTTRGCPPARLLDLRRVDVGERVRGHEAVALEEGARALG